MMNLKNLLTKPLQLQQIPKVVPITISVLSLIGFAIATYLTVEHFQGVIPPCSISGCETVLSSSYSEIFGIPVSLFGSLYYFTILVSLLIYFDVKNTLIKDYCLKLVMVLSAVGLIASIIFISIMLFVLHAICVYCLASDIISIIIFILASHILYLGLIKTNQ
jgi:uncharacterized membrane protein